VPDRRESGRAGDEDDRLRSLAQEERAQRSRAKRSVSPSFMAVKTCVANFPRISRI
jgi:hypothetical protein